MDIVNPSNNVALGLFLKGELDLSNNFLPGIATLVEGGYGVKTWYDDPPYMLSANTAFLFMNTKKKPMDDPAFRRALAYAINVDEIVTKVYGNIVRKANPTGLLPVWEQYVDQAVVDELGFSYNPDQAKRILDQAGYKDVNGDGWREAPDGSKIELKVIVPFGWTDWMESIKVIATSAQAVGINLQPDFPDFPSYWEMVPGGNFDMAINNFGSNLSSTPWTFYNWVFNHPIQDTMFNGNFGRYENEEVFALVDQLDRVPVEDIEGMKQVMSQIQRIQLTEMPAIPLWYNGLWAQWNETYWTNWPSAAGGSAQVPAVHLERLLEHDRHPDAHRTEASPAVSRRAGRPSLCRRRGDFFQRGKVRRQSARGTPTLLLPSVQFWRQAASAGPVTNPTQLPRSVRTPAKQAAHPSLQDHRHSLRIGGVAVRRYLGRKMLHLPAHLLHCCDHRLADSPLDAGRSQSPL